MNKHPVVDMLDEREPEATEYWLHDDEIAAIASDQEQGRDTPASLASRYAAWEGKRRNELAAAADAVPSPAADPVVGGAPDESERTCPACDSVWCRCALPLDADRDQLAEPGAALAVDSSDNINAIVEDYRTGRIDSAAFQAEVKAWKENWQRRIAGILPGHELSAGLDTKTNAILIRLTPTGRASPPTSRDSDGNERMRDTCRSGGDGPSR